MDYSKSGGQKAGKNAPRHKEHNQKGSAQNPFGDDDPKATNPKGKAALLARMKAAAQSGKK